MPGSKDKVAQAYVEPTIDSQARVLYELGQRPVTATGDLRRALDLDAGYLSRLLAALETEGRRARLDRRRRRCAEATAQLPLLLVEPSGRGMGVGARLVEQCVQFARQAGYTSITRGRDPPLPARRLRAQRGGGASQLRSRPRRPGV